MHFDVSYFFFATLGHIFSVLFFNIKKNIVLNKKKSTFLSLE